MLLDIRKCLVNIIIGCSMKFSEFEICEFCRLFNDLGRGDIIYKSDNNGKTRTIIANTGVYVRNPGNLVYFFRVITRENPNIFSITRRLLWILNGICAHILLRKTSKYWACQEHTSNNSLNANTVNQGLQESIMVGVLYEVIPIHHENKRQ